MKMMKNPFRPSSGSIPLSLAGREEIVNDILEGLDNAPGDPNRNTIFVGARGTGKTVLMAHIAEKAEQRGWVCIDVTSGSDVLEDIIVEVQNKAQHIITPKTMSRISGLSLAGIRVSFEGSTEKSNWRREMTTVIEELNAAGAGLLITVDEVSITHEGLKQLISVFQHFVRERRDVALIMAGLPGNVSRILTDEQISFTRKAFKHYMKPIAESEVAYAIRETVEIGGRSISDEALWLAAEKTGGFAFLIQLLGYHMWRQSPASDEISVDDVKKAAVFAQKDLDNMLYEVMISELTEREKMFVCAMALDDGDSAIIDIADRIGISPNNAAKLKKRLVERGVITSPARGKVAFDMPMLTEYLRKENL